MAWIAFASVPTILLMMLAMGHLEARLLPGTPDPNADLDRIRADLGIRAEAGTRADTDARPDAAARPEASAHPKVSARADTGGRADAAPRWEVVVGRVDGREEART